MTDLIKRLRTYRPPNEWGDGCWHTICDEAADAIEAQQAEIARLRAALSDLTTVCEQIVDAGHMDTEDLARLRAALESK